MAITTARAILHTDIVAFRALVLSAIANSEFPIGGATLVTGASDAYPQFVQIVGAGAPTATVYNVIHGHGRNDFRAKATAAITSGGIPFGTVSSFNLRNQPGGQVNYLMTFCDATQGGGGGGLVIGTTSTTAMAGNKVPTTTDRGGVIQQAAIVALTDSSGGTSGGNTVAAIPAVVAAATSADTATLPTKTSVDATVTAIKNDIATLAAKINALNTAIKTGGVTA